VRGLDGDLGGEQAVVVGFGNGGDFFAEVGIDDDVALRDGLVRFEREFDGGTVERFEIAMILGELVSLAPV
jgi:hypothetical protein